MQTTNGLPQGQQLFEQVLLFGEDRIFYRHHGFSRSDIRGAWAYNKKYGKKIGNSTITQQLARILYLSLCLAPFALKLLPLTERKKTLMRAYALLHYGTALTSIKPQAVGLHWAAWTVRKI